MKMEKEKILELFSGTESFSKIAKKRGHKVFTIDYDKQFNPNLCIDILDFDISMLPEEFKHPSIIWASPPCTTFSVASIYRYWHKGKPKNEKTLKGIEIVKKTLKIIEDLKPKYYIIENPRGMLRKQRFMRGLHRDTVTYCQYGYTIQKPTDLWNNLNHQFKPMCHPKSPCHERAGRGSKNGLQRIKNSYDLKTASLRATIPPKLCLEIIKCCEKKKRIIQKVLI